MAQLVQFPKRKSSAWEGQSQAIGAYFLSAALGVSLWYIVSLKFDVTIFPSPSETLLEAYRLLSNGELVSHAAVSAFRIVAGFLIGCLIGVPVGLLMGVSNWFRRAAEPVTEFFRFVPAISMIVFAIIWFGIGEESKIFLIVFNTLFIMIINVEAGVNAVPKNALRAADMLGASTAQRFRHVVVPATVPYLITGMRLAMGRSFTTIAAAEIVGASGGIGFLIFSSREFGRMDTVLVGIVTLALLGFAMDAVFRRIARYVSGELAGGLFR